MNKINNINEFELLFSKINRKTKDIDKFNKELIKNKQDVSFLKEYVLSKQEYHRTYFQVSLSYLNDYVEQLKFIEDNLDKLNDWWHVDQLTQFIKKDLSIDYAYSKAIKYINSPHTFTRRWAYVMFMPRLVKEKDAFDKIITLLKSDDEYYVVMAEAWLISFLAVYHPEKTLLYLKTKPLKYNIVGKAIQKICDSFRISNKTKEEFKKIRTLYR